jgi:hypothetical protein
MNRRVGTFEPAKELNPLVVAQPAGAHDLRLRRNAGGRMNTSLKRRGERLR